MSIQKVLIFAKKSAYQTYFNEYQERPLRQLARKGDKVLLGIHRSHNTHYDTLAYIQEVLKKKGLSFQTRFRGQFFDPKKFDLIISVGGDGTFLEASRRLTHSLILGVNSDKTHSVGKLCVAAANSFEKSLGKVLRGDFETKRLNRMKIVFNGKPLDFFILNDVLVSHSCPAAMSHYLLKFGTLKEPQRGSGVWISTATGATAVMHSAGGQKMSATSTDLQYFPRELFEGHGKRYQLRGGLIQKGKSLCILSQMREGMLYLDGAHRAMPFEYGDEIKVSSGTALKTVSF